MSVNTLVLDNPILINNQEISELTYDATQITAEQFSIACAKSAALDKTRSITFKAKENDYALHLYLGMMAVIAVNPAYTVEDLERVKGFDVLDLTNIGTFFTMRRSAVPSEPSSSDEQSEDIAVSSTQASEN